MHWLSWWIKIVLLWAGLLLTDAEHLICFDILQEAQVTNGSPLDTFICKIREIFSHVLPLYTFDPVVVPWLLNLLCCCCREDETKCTPKANVPLILFGIHSDWSTLCSPVRPASVLPSFSPSVVCRPGLTKARQYWRSHLLPPFGPHVWEGGGGTVHCAWPAYVHVFCFVCPLAGALHAERPWYSHILSPPSSHVWEGYTGMWRRNARVESVVEKSWSKFKLFKLYLMFCFWRVFLGGATNAFILVLWVILFWDNKVRFDYIEHLCPLT